MIQGEKNVKQKFWVIFGSKNILVKKNLVKTNFRSENCDSKKIWVKEISWVKKKILSPKKMLAPKKNFIKILGDHPWVTG